jgi:predicted XRE-type DNA-binding protein
VVTEAARRPGLTQPRLNDLMRGRLDKFNLDALINLARAAGLAVRLILKRLYTGRRHHGCD